MALFDVWDQRRIFMTLDNPKFKPVPSFWKDTFFGQSYFSEEQDIKIAKLPMDDRYMAPFVEPHKEGRPVYVQNGWELESIKPAYIKMLDAVRPEEMANPGISELRLGRKLSITERFDGRVLELMQQHNRRLQMREAEMACRTAIDGKYRVIYKNEVGEPTHDVTLNFGRDPNLTVIKNADYWDDPDFPILEDIEEMADTQQGAVRGGYPTRMIVGKNVAKVFRKNKQIREELVPATVRRGAEVDMQTGIIRQSTVEQPFVELGTVGSGITVASYHDEIQNDDGTMLPMFDPDSIALIAPGYTGVRAYGAIWDVKAFQGGQALATDKFVKMYEENNPSAIFLLTQSAPIMFPLYPNRIMTAKVLGE